MKNKDSFLRSLTVLFSGTVIGQMIGVLSIPVVAWFYNPAEFGRFTAIWVVGSTCGSLFSLRYERLVSVARLDSIARHISAVAYVIATMLLVVTGVVFLLSRQIDSALTGNLTALELFFLLILVYLVSIFQIRSQWLIRECRFKRLAFSEVFGLSVTLLLQTLFGIYGWLSAESLLCSAMFGKVIQVFTTISGKKWNLQGLSLKRAICLARKYKVYPSVSAPYSLVSVSASRALIVVAAAFLSAEIVGYISLAYRLVYLPMSTVTNAIRRVYITRLRAQFGTDDLHVVTLCLVKIVTLLLVPYYLIVGVLLPELIVDYLPPKWHGATRFILLLLPGAGAMLVTAWFDRVYEVLGRQKTAFSLELMSSTLIIFIYWLMLASNQSADVAIGTFSLLIALYNIFWIVFSWKVAGFPVLRFVTEVAMLFLYVIAVVLIWYGMSNMGELRKLIGGLAILLICCRVSFLLVKNAMQLKLE